ncbi:MAG: nitrate reductase [Porticoccaceae bacterium]|nr:MAG: nitrate reductase [Porticoccaceae bacterium]
MAATVATTCPYCGVGCGVLARGEGARVAAVSGDPAHPANRGRLCVKGKSLAETTELAGRLLAPRVPGREVSWEEALDAVAQGFGRALAEHGPDSVAFYLSGQLLTEDYYAANKLAKGFLGTANVDTNSRLCMASATVAHQRAFGEDLVPGCYEDLELADLVVIVGSNTAWNHPVVYQRLAAARAARPEMRIVVVDPRRTATCELADLHLQIRAGTDAFLFAGLFRHLVESDAWDRRFVAEHTTGFEAALAALAGLDLARLHERLGVPAEALDTFFSWFAARERTVTLYSQGINQSGSGADRASLIINCHLLTGRIGRPGATPFSITGQPNAMGGREVGGLATQLAAHMDFAPENVDRVGRFWGAARVAERPGLKAVELFEAVRAGKIRALWILATNPAVSLPEADRVREALAACPLVVVSDCVADTDTARLAHILLPAAAWGEKNGTVTNSERTISRCRGAVPPPGEARPDWWMLAQVARRLGHGRAFDWRHPAEIFREHAALSAFENGGERVFNLEGLADLDRAAYDALAPVQWPVTRATPQGTRRLFADGRFPTPDGRARFHPVAPTGPCQRLDHRFPWVLNTGRLRDQWHTMTRTGRAPRLLRHRDRPELSIHPEDAARQGLREGDLVRLESATGSALLPVRLDGGVRPGELFAPMHWSGPTAPTARVNALVAAVTDPFSGQPESKFVPVRLRREPAAWWVLVASREPLPEPQLDFWVRGPLVGGFRLLGAALAPAAVPAEAWLEALAEGVAEDSPLVYRHPAAGHYRLAIRRAGRLALVAFAAPKPGELPESAALESLLALPEVDWRVLSGRVGTDPGRLVCTCFEVGERAIRAAVAGGCRTPEALGEQLRCGTNCGSCLPELRALLAAASPNP